MAEISPELLQLGTIGILFLLFIKEFFAYLREKKNQNNNNGAVLKALEILKNNHLNSLEAKIERMDDKLDKIITLLELIREKLKNLK